VRWILLLGLVGCYAPAPPANLRCGEGSTCPSGQPCIAGFCGGPPITDDASLDPDTFVEPADGPADAAPVPPQMAFGEGDDTLTNTWVDAFLSEGEPTNNFGNHPDLHLTSSETSPVLIRIDVSAVPSHATVTSARLRFRVTDATLPIGTKIEIYAMNESWTEGTGDHSGGIANLTDRNPGVAWSEVGATPPSRDVVPISTTNVAALLDFGDALVIDLPTALIAGWIANPNSNSGIAMMVDGVDFYCELGSSEFSTTNFRPRLELDLE